MVSNAIIGFEQAIAFAEKRGVKLPTEYYGKLQGLARTLGFSIAGIMDLLVLEAVRDSLADAYRRGLTFAQWQSQVSQQQLMLPAYRLKTILQTNTQNAYNRGRCHVFAERKDRLPYLVYDAVNDSRTRASHAAMDGYCARWDDPIWRIWTPINGYNCRCRLLQVSKWSAEPYLLQKPTPPDVRPDAGFDYNPCEDIYTGVAQGVPKTIFSRAKESVMALVRRLVK